MTAGFSHMSQLPSGSEETLRRHVYVDTMGFHPALIRAAVEMLGVRNVLAGSDWPIVSEGPIKPLLGGALEAAGLTADEQALIAGGNALRLLGVSQ